jgi:hypothetical protein
VTAREPDWDGIGAVPGGGYPVPERPTNPGTTRERWLWTAVVVAIGLLVFGLLIFGGAGGLRPDLEQVQVSDVLTSPGGPAARFGTHEIRIVGWFAQVTAGCQGDTGGADVSVAWLQAACPVRVLLPSQPAPTASQAELVRDGLRLAAPNGQPFPPPTPAGAGTAGLEQLVFTGHFEDAAAQRCIPARQPACRDTFVVSDYTGLIK